MVNYAIMERLIQLTNHPGVKLGAD